MSKLPFDPKAFVLSEQESIRIFEQDIVPAEFRDLEKNAATPSSPAPSSGGGGRRGSSKPPVAVLIVGQTGAGKTQAAPAIKEVFESIVRSRGGRSRSRGRGRGKGKGQNGDDDGGGSAKEEEGEEKEGGRAEEARPVLAHFVADTYKTYHPAHAALSAADQEGDGDGDERVRGRASAATGPDARRWLAMAARHAVALRLDVLLESACRHPEDFIQLARLFAEEGGYRVEVALLAVPAGLSRLGILTRYYFFADDDNNNQRRRRRRRLLPEKEVKEEEGKKTEGVVDAGSPPPPPPSRRGLFSLLLSSSARLGIFTRFFVPNRRQRRRLVSKKKKREEEKGKAESESLPPPPPPPPPPRGGLLPARLTPRKVHDDSYEGLLRAAEFIDASAAVDQVVVVRRDNLVAYANEKEKEGAWKQQQPGDDNPGAAGVAEALRRERRRPLLEGERTAAAEDLSRLRRRLREMGGSSSGGGGRLLAAQLADVEALLEPLLTTEGAMAKNEERFPKVRPLILPSKNRLLSNEDGNYVDLRLGT